MALFDECVMTDGVSRPSRHFSGLRTASEHVRDRLAPLARGEFQIGPCRQPLPRGWGRTSRLCVTTRGPAFETRGEPALDDADGSSPGTARTGGCPASPTPCEDGPGIGVRLWNFVASTGHGA
jgi:hypothetical protein